MKDILEIRWHGRGGQGVKTAALLLADVAFHMGKFVQGFPEYGPERMGAPVTAYDRVSDRPLRVHSNIYRPDYVVVVDESLLRGIDVTAGLGPEGGVLVNTARPIQEIRSRLRGYEGTVATVNARAISEELLGAYFPNMSMLSGVIKMTGIMEDSVFLHHMEASLLHKFSARPRLAAGNLEVLRRSLKEVKGL